MKLRVLEICKEQGISLRQLASRMGIQQANLSQSLNGNPTVNTLQAVADCLHVQISELFEKTESSISGFLDVDGDLRRIIGKKDLIPIVGNFGVKSYVSFKECKKDLKAFVKSCRKAEGTHSFAAIMNGDTLVVVTAAGVSDEDSDQGIVYDSNEYVIVSFREGADPMTTNTSEMEFSDGYGHIDYNGMFNHLWGEFTGSVFRDQELSDEELEDIGVI